ncbi:MAG: hypothetical protein AAGF12_38525 [Myxococcota bacterium]
MRHFLTLLFAMAVGLGATPTSAQYCDFSSPECAQDSSFYHQLVLRRLFSSATWTPTAFEATLGRINFFGTDYLAACVNDGSGEELALLYDQTDTTLLSSLTAHSFFCGSSGADTIRVLVGGGFQTCGDVIPGDSCIRDIDCNSNEVCVENRCLLEADLLQGVSTSGHDLDIYGGASNDRLFGVLSPPTVVESTFVCGGSGDDTITDTRFIDGWTGNDQVLNVAPFGRAYGFSGCDRMSCGLGTDNGCFGEGGSDCVQETSTNGPPVNTTIDCGPGRDYSIHGTGVNRCEFNIFNTCLGWSPDFSGPNPDAC